MRDSVNGLTASSVAYKRLRVGGLVEDFQAALEKTPLPSLQLNSSTRTLKGGHMRLTMILTIACLFGFCLAGLPWEQPVRAVRLIEQPNHSSTVRARAIVSGPNGISGEVLFFQGPCPGCPTPAPGAPTEHFINFPEPGVLIVATISGPVSALTPGAHGVHIHEVGLW